MNNGAISNWNSGFWGGAVGTLLSFFANTDDYYLNVATNAGISGTTSWLTGGKFSNGAILGAFRYMFNEAAHKMTERQEMKFIEARMKRELFMMDNPNAKRGTTGFEGYRSASGVAFGDPIDKANASGNAATLLSGVSGFVATRYKNLIGLTVAGVLDSMAGVALVNKHLLLVEAGQFNQNNLILDSLTYPTAYCKQPVVDWIYDESFTRGGDWLFNGQGQ